jgi:hypothetical protein
MRPDILEGVRTLQWSGLHPPHASGITDILNEQASAYVAPGGDPSGRANGTTCDRLSVAGRGLRLLWT